MFLNKSENPIETVKSDFPVKLSLVVCVLGILLVGLFSNIFSQIGMFSFGM